MAPGGMTIRSSVLVGALALAFSVGSAPQGQQLDPLQRGPTTGVQFHCNWGGQSDAHRQTVAAKLGAAGVKTVRIDLGWSSLQPTRRKRVSGWHVRLADRCVNLARAQGMDVLFTIIWTPGWANGGRDALGAADPEPRVRMVRALGSDSLPRARLRLGDLERAGQQGSSGRDRRAAT